jgi:hypothetical protein
MRERIHFRKIYADTRRTLNQHQAAHLSKGKRDRSRLALAPQFSLNPHHRKKAMSRRTRPVHETSSDKCKRCGIITRGSSNALHLSACGSSQDQHLGRAGTWHRCPATAVADCISFDPEKVCGCSYLLKEPRKSQWITYWWRDVLAISIRCTFQICHPRKMTPLSPTIGRFALYSSGLCFKTLNEMKCFVTRDYLQRMAAPQSDAKAR